MICNHCFTSSILWCHVNQMFWAYNKANCEISVHPQVKSLANPSLGQNLKLSDDGWDFGILFWAHRALYVGKESPHGHKLWVGVVLPETENTYYVMLVKGWSCSRLQAKSLAELRTPQTLGGPWDSVSCGDDEKKILSLFKMWIVLASFGLGFGTWTGPNVIPQLENDIIWIG